MSKPIRDDPKLGQWVAVASWRVLPTDRVTITEYKQAIEHFLETRLGLVHDRRPIVLHVSAYEHGAGGERSEHEGAVGLTEDDVPTQGRT
jgi:hypothetical protein